MGRSVGHEASNVVATLPTPGGGTEAVFVSIDIKPSDTEMIAFAPTRDRRVTADGSADALTFVAADKTKYLWLSDLRDLTAQRTTGKVAARLHEVGLDEFEWSRLMHS